MIEKTVRDFLKTKLGSIPVYLEIPSNPPKKFVFVQKTGGSYNNLIKESTFAIQSYDDTMFKASSLNEDIKDLILGTDSDAGLLGLNDICSTSLNSDYPYPNVDRTEYRYQAVFEIVHY